MTQHAKVWKSIDGPAVAEGKLHKTLIPIDLETTKHQKCKQIKLEFVICIWMCPESSHSLKREIAALRKVKVKCVRPAPKRVEKVMGKYDFDGSDPDDLPFKKGELLTVVSKVV